MKSQSRRKLLLFVAYANNNTPLTTALDCRWCETCVTLTQPVIKVGLCDFGQQRGQGELHPTPVVPVCKRCTDPTMQGEWVEWNWERLGQSSDQNHAPTDQEKLHGQRCSCDRMTVFITGKARRGLYEGCSFSDVRRSINQEVAVRWTFTWLQNTLLRSST